MNNDDLIRIEHKLDLIIYALQSANLMIKELPQLEGIEQDLCALCKEPIRLLINPKEGTLVRACGCKLPKQAYKLTLHNKEASNANNRTEEDPVPSNGKE